jgi:hypothetical protein
VLLNEERMGDSRWADSHKRLQQDILSAEKEIEAIDREDARSVYTVTQWVELRKELVEQALDTQAKRRDTVVYGQRHPPVQPVSMEGEIPNETLSSNTTTNTSAILRTHSHSSTTSPIHTTKNIMNAPSQEGVGNFFIRDRNS